MEELLRNELTEELSQRGFLFPGPWRLEDTESVNGRYVHWNTVVSTPCRQTQIGLSIYLDHASVTHGGAIFRVPFGRRRVKHSMTHRYVLRRILKIVNLIVTRRVQRQFDTTTRRYWVCLRGTNWHKFQRVT
jgi:hypothetical protein